MQRITLQSDRLRWGLNMWPLTVGTKFPTYAVLALSLEAGGVRGFS